MNNDELKQFIIEKMVEVERRLTEIEQRLQAIENEWRMVKKVVWIILSVVAAKLGIDLTGLTGGG